MNPAPATSPSSTTHPDMDWSQMRETILMLHLSMAQIELAMHDSTGSVSDLTDSFTHILKTLNTIQQISQKLPNTPKVKPAKVEIENLGGDVKSKVNQALVAFQFYDRLSQRLSHVCRSLDELSVLVSDPMRLYNPNAWVELQQHLRAKYVTEDDRHMFDTLMKTRNVHLALEEFKKIKAEQKPNGDIEFF